MSDICEHGHMWLSKLARTASICDCSEFGSRPARLSSFSERALQFGITRENKCWKVRAARCRAFRFGRDR